MEIQQEKGGLLEPTKVKKTGKQTKILNHVEVKDHLTNMYLQNKKLMDWAFGKVIQPGEQNNRTDKMQKIGFQVNDFFLEILAVSPNRFRPDNKLGDQIFLHAHTAVYTKVLSINQEIKLLMMRKNAQEGKETDSKGIFDFNKTNCSFVRITSKKNKKRIQKIKQRIRKEKSLSEYFLKMVRTSRNSKWVI
jgi:hypothetical protein